MDEHLRIKVAPWTKYKMDKKFIQFFIMDEKVKFIYNE
jgi:hypothetical protein